MDVSYLKINDITHNLPLPTSRVRRNKLTSKPRLKPHLSGPERGRCTGLDVDSGKDPSEHVLVGALRIEIQHFTINLLGKFLSRHILV